MNLTVITKSNEAINTIKLNSFSVDELKKILALRKELTAIVDNANNLKIAVMQKFEVPSVMGQYDFPSHKEHQAIYIDLEKITNEEYKLKSECNFITFDQLKASLTEGHNADTVTVLYDLLVKIDQ